MTNDFIQRQIEQADKMIAQLTEQKKPYMKEYRIVSRINRKLTKVRREKRGLLHRIQQENVLWESVDNSIDAKEE